ncbi:type VI secretion system baseplate subunit TssF [uncultured Desulfovibrio sp.]|uniref:type VI secretion system baseplate subunit TssF n=2 Tax=uncultured Desulfovibrio sp. TaxID=167968 RepID=UPI0032090BAD
MDTYYQKELSVLREDAQAFGRRYPALAPMMQPGSDPDVERILEGVAYLCGRIRQRLDQTAPELLQTLLRLTFPHAVLPTPSTTLMAFAPRADVRELLSLRRGTELASRPVNGVPCLYTLDDDAALLPMQVLNIAFDRHNDTTGVLSLHLHSAIPLAALGSTPLRLHLAAPYAEAVQQYYALRQGLVSMEILAGKRSWHLDASALKPAVLPAHDRRLAAGRGLARAYMTLHRYFLQPQQLLFFQLHGLDRLPLPDEAGGYELRFHLRGEAVRGVTFRDDAFLLNVFPASNICRVASEPVNITHMQEEYVLRPQDGVRRSLDILSVEQATALFAGGRTEEFTTFENSDPQQDGGVYQLRCRPSPVSGQPEHLIMPLYRSDKVLSTQPYTLALRLRCCNTTQPAQLQVGDICESTDSSPALATFRNILAPTPTLPRPADESLLWRFVGHINANLLSLASPRALRDLLALYLPPPESAQELFLANRRRCDAISEFSSVPTERLFRGRLFRGYELRLALRREGFTSAGDAYLFCGALDDLLAEFSLLNNYTQLHARLANEYGSWSWTPHLGTRPLI